MSKELGAQIKYYRNQKRMTQEELAQKVGLATITIRQYESGAREPNASIVVQIADALHVFWLDLYPEEQRESIAWEATRTGKINPYPPKTELVDVDKALQMGLVSLPIEWGARKRAEYYFNLLNDCGQDVAVQTAKSRISAIQKDKAAEFGFYMDKLDDASLKIVAQALEDLTGIQAYQKPIDPDKK